MAYSRSLNKSFNGAKDMEMSQSKKQTSACLTIVEKEKIQNVTKKNSYMWLGFKAMNALNASGGLEEIPHKNVTELVKNGMSEKEALECHNCIILYPFVAQEIWSSADESWTTTFSPYPNPIWHKSLWWIYHGLSHSFVLQSRWDDHTLRKKL